MRLGWHFLDTRYPPQFSAEPRQALFTETFTECRAIRPRAGKFSPGHVGAGDGLTRNVGVAVVVGQRDMLWLNARSLSENVVGERQ